MFITCCLSLCTVDYTDYIQLIDRLYRVSSEQRMLSVSYTHLTLPTIA